MNSNNWPALPLNEWLDTCQTLQLWMQIVGKIRLVLTPPLNHWWHVALYVSSRGLTTSTIPYGPEKFEIEFDFIDHRLEVRSSTGDRKSLPLIPEPVAVFYERVMALLHSIGIEVAINTKPQELPHPIPFEEDVQHAAYDREYVHRFWRILLETDIVLNEFRSSFIGKSSPVHFFWGAADLAYTRFSGRPAPPRKGVISSEGYSHEEISVGFWPGSGVLQSPAYYAYTVPQPPGLPDQRVKPAAAFWHKELSEFILMYDDVRRAQSPRAMLREFFESAYTAGAKLAGWDRKALER